MVALLFFALYGIVYGAAVFLAIVMRRQVYGLLSVLVFLAPYAVCATSYQGARFRLWFEPFIVLAAAAALHEIHRAWTDRPMLTARFGRKQTHFLYRIN
jgi:hypothetical protein